MPNTSPQPIRVVRVAERLPPLPGGKELHVAELSRNQLALGDDVELVYGSGDGPAVSPNSRRIAVPGYVGERGAISTLVFAILASFRVLGARRFDVLHVHGDFIDVAPLALAARLRRARVVLTVHGSLSPRYRRAVRLIFSCVDDFIALGSRVEQELRERGVPDRKIHTMSSGLNTRILDSAYTADEPLAGTVVSVGSLDPVKNHALVIEAVKLLPPSVRVRLQVVGDGPDRERLEALAGGSDRIEFLGRVSREEVYERVARAQVFVLASVPTATKGEGVPTALLEAMYLSRHCLVSDCARPEPVVRDPGSYETFDPTDAGSLTRLLGLALSTPERNAEVGARARRAVAHLDWPSVTAQVRAVLVPRADEEWS